MFHLAEIQTAPLILGSKKNELRCVISAKLNTHTFLCKFV